MVKDVNLCSSCGLCTTICPNNCTLEYHHSLHAYAGWNTNSAIRNASASGGIAAALYQYAKEKNMYFAGTLLDKNFEAHYCLTNDPSYIKKFQNSKYTFSYMDELYGEIQEKLACNIGVLYIGLPCQAAALKRYLTVTKTCMEKLIVVDLICHGTPIPSHLKDHIKAIQKKKKTVFDKCHFRDASFNTSNFIFSLYQSDRKKPRYKKGVQSNDVFQIGYHKGWIYRECCYQCHYAKTSRIGDITIGDYHGLGQLTEYNDEKQKVSVIFSNTQHGQNVLKNLLQKKLVILHERPIEEPVANEPQLNYPSIGGKRKEQFGIEYNKKHDFEKAAKAAFKNQIIKNQVYVFVKKILPSFIVVYIKNIRNKMEIEE